MSTPHKQGHPLTTGQLALLEAELTRRQHQLDAALANHLAGRTRAEHAAELLEQDTDDAPQRESEREMDQAISERELGEIAQVSNALRRLREHDYGRCSDCGTDIPFDRLKAEPWALRCVSCQSTHEQRRRTP